MAIGMLESLQKMGIACPTLGTNNGITILLESKS
jgi:hypothetical protein